MKKIFLVRHAKSSWADLSLRDIERPLNKRGKRDAPFMAKLIAGKMPAPDAIVSSSAKRAFTTATQFAKAWGWSKKQIHINPSIYDAYSLDILELIRSLNDDWQCVFIFGHNPTFTDLANQFPGGEHIDNVPTCGIVYLASKTKTWQNFSPQNTEVLQFYYPKQFFS